MSEARRSYHSALKNMKPVGEESEAQRAERVRSERTAMLIQTLGQALPAIGGIAGMGIGAYVGGVPGATIGGGLGSAAGQVGNLAAGSAAMGMTEEGDRREFEREERRRRRESLLQTAMMARPQR